MILVVSLPTQSGQFRAAGHQNQMCLPILKGEGKATSAEGASEGSQGQAALRAAPGSSEKLNRALKGRSKRQHSIPYVF